LNERDATGYDAPAALVEVGGCLAANASFASVPSGVGVVPFVLGEALSALWRAW
jgi:hypothetical protein